MLALTTDQEALVREVLLRNIPGRVVMVFGSRATGNAKPYSDLDLVIMVDTPLPVRTIRQLRDDFDDSPLPFQVDLVDWATTNEEFRRIIQASAVELVHGE